VGLGGVDREQGKKNWRGGNESWRSGTFFFRLTSSSHGNFPTGKFLPEKVSEIPALKFLTGFCRNWPYGIKWFLPPCQKVTLPYKSVTREYSHLILKYVFD